MTGFNFVLFDFILSEIMYVLLTMILVASPLEVDFVKRINFRPVIIMIEN